MPVLIALMFLLGTELSVKSFADVARNPKAVLTATIRVYELLGAEVYLYFDIHDTNCTARVNPRTTARPGDTVKLAMDLTKIHIFDKDTEKVVVN